MAKLFDKEKNNKNKKIKKNYYRKVKQNNTKKKSKGQKKNITVKKHHFSNLLHNWKKIVYKKYDWQKIATSDNFKYMTAIVNSPYNPDPEKNPSIVFHDNVFVSNNYGEKWKIYHKKNDINWNGIAINGSGQYQTVSCEGKNIYTSSDYGLSWKEHASKANWISICISENGKYQSVVANGFFPNIEGKGYIYTSKDYGNTWHQKTELNVSWSCNAMSSDGRIQTSGSFFIDGLNKFSDKHNGYVYNSYDYGDTWEKNKSLKQSWWASTSMSNDGKNQIICGINCNLDIVPPGPIYISYDYGKIFSKVICPEEPWLSVSMSKSGQYILASSFKQEDTENKDIPNTGGMILSQDYGKTWKYTNAPRSKYICVVISKDGLNGVATAWQDGIFKC